MRWIKNQLNDEACSVVISGPKPSWRPVASGLPQDSIVCPILFNIFISDLDDGIECTLSKFADDTKLRGVANSPECHAAMQRDLNRLEKWADWNLMKFNRGNCKVLHLRRNNPMHKYMVGPTVWRTAWQRRTLEFWWTTS